MFGETQSEAVRSIKESRSWGWLNSIPRAKSNTHSVDGYASLPGYGKVYLNHLIGEFYSLKTVCKNDLAMQLGEKIAAKAAASPQDLTWGDAYALDEAIAQMLPTEYLHQRAWCLEARYKDAVGNTDAYEAFMKVESPHLVDETEEHLRARIHNMIRELYRLYTVISCREDMREKLARHARLTLLIILSGIAFFSIAGSIASSGLWHTFDVTRFSPESLVNIWGLVFAAGATGGLVSMQRRLQNLPTYGESLSDLVELSNGVTIKLAPVLGGIFAVVLFLMFCSGLASGDLFPHVDLDQNNSSFIQFANHLEMKGASQWGKLLVWSFIAGFAERFVPDTLDRLIARSEKDKK